MEKLSSPVVGMSAMARRMDSTEMFGLSPDTAASKASRSHASSASISGEREMKHISSSERRGSGRSSSEWMASVIITSSERADSDPEP